MELSRQENDEERHEHIARQVVGRSAGRKRTEQRATDDNFQALTDVSEDALSNALDAFGYFRQADGGERDYGNDEGRRIDKNRDRRGQQLDKDAGRTRRCNRCHAVANG